MYASPTGALVAYNDYDSDGEDTGFTLWAADEPTFQKILRLLPPSPAFVIGHEPFYAEQLRRHLRVAELSYCFQAAYLGSEPLPVPELFPQIRRLEREYFPLVRKNYDLASDEYLQWLMERGMLYGAFDGDVLTGFVGTHAEGTIGLLEVLPAYRRHGIGAALQSFMTNLELSRGHVPYGQIFVDNDVSQALQRRLGFQFSAGRLFWVTGDTISPS
ncbi:MAG: GNAT family N-acetyltransferase [Oscillospiraceae bacterium]